MVQIDDGLVADVVGPHAPAGTFAGLDWHARAGRDAVGAGIGAEVIVERVVLLEQDDEVVDGRDRSVRAVRRLGGARAQRHRREYRGNHGRAGHRTAADHGRTS